VPGTLRRVNRPIWTRLAVLAASVATAATMIDGAQMSSATA